MTTHIEDLLNNPESSFCRAVSRGLRAAHSRAKDRGDSRFDVVLLGPPENNAYEATQIVGHPLGVAVDTQDRMTPEALRRAWSNAQRRASPRPWRGPVCVRFVSSNDSNDELIAGSRWEDIQWGPRAHLEVDAPEGFDEEALWHTEPDEDDDPLGFGRPEIPDNGGGVNPGYTGVMRLGMDQRALTKDIERDGMLKMSFDLLAELVSTIREDSRAAQAFQRDVAKRAVDNMFGGGGGGGGGGAAAPRSDAQRGMTLLGDFMKFAKTMGSQNKQRREGRQQRHSPQAEGGAHIAQPTLPPGPFDETRWDGATQQGGAVQSILEAGSPGELVPEGSNSNLPVRVEQAAPPMPMADPMATIDGMSDAQLIRVMQHRIGGIAGEHADLVDGFLNERLDELEGGGGYDDDDDDDDDPYLGM